MARLLWPTADTIAHLEWGPESVLGCSRLDWAGLDLHTRTRRRRNRGRLVAVAYAAYNDHIYHLPMAQVLPKYVCVCLHLYVCVCEWVITCNFHSFPSAELSRTRTRSRSRSRSRVCATPDGAVVRCVELPLPWTHYTTSIVSVFRTIITYTICINFKTLQKRKKKHEMLKKTEGVKERGRLQR